MTDRRRHRDTKRDRLPPAPAAEPVRLRAVKLVGGGRALAHADGATWMVRGALPGELVLARPTRRRAQIVEAVAVELVADPHPARLRRPCPHADDCGGCDWPRVDTEAGAALKSTVAAEAASRFPAISSRLAEAPVTTSPPAYRLRNRLHWDPRSGRLGFYDHRSRRVADISECRIVTSTLAELFPSLRKAVASTCTAPVDVETLEGGSGLIAALRPVASSSRGIPASWVPDRDRCPGIDGFHRLDRNLELTPGWGRTEVVMTLPVPLSVPIGSFFQGNTHLIPHLFKRAAQLIGSGAGPVFDLHGGVGFFAAAASSVGRSDLTVVEPNRGAAEAARRNLPRAEVHPITAERFLLARDLPPRAAVVVTDPPRSGLTPELRSHLARWRPEKIVTVGCDPATWARDAAHLLGHGFEMTHLELIDLFPSTHHVEVVAVLEST